MIKNINLCNVAYMPIFEGKRLEFVGVKFNEAEKDAFEKIADKEDRGVSYVVRELALRGLAYYLEDNKLKATAEEVESAQRIIHLDENYSDETPVELPGGFQAIGFDGQTNSDMKKISEHIKKKKAEKESKEKPKK